MLSVLTLLVVGVMAGGSLGAPTLGVVVQSVRALPADSALRGRALAVEPANLAELTEAIRAAAKDLSAEAAAGRLEGAALQRAELELRPFAALDAGIEAAWSELGQRERAERETRAHKATQELETALSSEREALVPSLGNIRQDHFHDRWLSAAAPLPSPTQREIEGRARHYEAAAAVAAGLEVFAPRDPDHAPAPAHFDNKTGALPLVELHDYAPPEKEQEALRTWARDHAGLAEAVGLRIDAFSGKVTAPLPRALKARLAHLHATGDALAPALRLIDVGPSPWREKLRALARGGFIAAGAGEDARGTYGALTLSAPLVRRLQRRAAALEKALSAGDVPPSKGEAFVAAWESRARLAKASKPQRARAAAVMTERRRWTDLRGWTFRQEVGLREFFRLHAPEIRATFASAGDWLSPSRRRIMRWMGFDFGERLRAPGYAEFDANYLKAADALGIADEDRLRFVLCYQDAQGRLIHIFPGEPAPKDAAPITRPLTTREILDLMAQGMFPLAHNEFLDQTGDVFYIHDAVSHGVSFLDKPWYARVVIEAARVLVRRDGGLMGLGNSVNRNGPLSDRLFYLLEEFMDFRTRFPEEELARILELPPSAGVDASMGELVAALERLPEDELRGRAARLVARMPSLVESIGGNAADDLFTRRDKLDDLKKPVLNKMYLSKTWKMVRQALEDPRANPEPLARAMARLQVYLLRLHASEPGRLLLDAARPVQDETSSFWQLMRGTGLLNPADPTELKLLRNMGLADDLDRKAETSEVEAKFLVPDLTLLRADLLEPLRSGAPSPRILRRGFVVQEYLAVTQENLRRAIALLDEAKIPFGTDLERHALLEPGNAAEIRLMTKSLRVHEPGDSLDLEARREFRQLTIKAVGGLSVTQLETPEALTPGQARRLNEIFEQLRPEKRSSVRKAYFEPVAFGPDGEPLLRPDGRPYTVEVDMFLDSEGGGVPQFINGEIEFHGATREEAVRLAATVLEDPQNLPEYLADDLTGHPAAKTREIAARGVPEELAAKLRPHAAANAEIVRALYAQFSTWAHPEILRLVRNML